MHGLGDYKSERMTPHSFHSTSYDTNTHKQSQPIPSIPSQNVHLQSNCLSPKQLSWYRHSIDNGTQCSNEAGVYEYLGVITRRVLE